MALSSAKSKTSFVSRSPSSAFSVLIARRALLAIALLVVGSALAASDPPSPTPSKSAGQSKSKSTQKGEDPKLDIRGTNSSPLVVEIAKSPVTQVEAADKTEKPHDYSSPEWWMVYITGALAAITILLALYTAKLYRATVRLGEDAEKATARQSGEMERSLAIAKVSADTAMESAKLAHAAFVAANLPRLVIVDVSMNNSKMVFIEFCVRNDGITTGEIISVVAHLWDTKIGDDLPAVPPYLGYALQFDPAKLHGGESTFPVRAFNATAPGTHFTYDEFEFAWRRLYLLGFVTYRDEIGNIHKTGFCRAYNDEGRAFDVVSSSIYEYQR